jgi:hypothetical protein
MDVLTVTLDTGVFDAPQLARVELAATGLAIEFAHVSVTARELEGATRTVVSKDQILETGVWDESRWDMAVFAGDEEPSNLEQILSVISGGGFPKPGKRDNLSEGYLHMLRDAMILEAHVREGRAIFVTRDTRAYVGRGGNKNALRAKLEAMFATRIMTVDEFCAECDRLKARE